VLAAGRESAETGLDFAAQLVASTSARVIIKGEMFDFPSRALKPPVRLSIAANSFDR
jgi:hypothetical protein